MDSVPDEQPDDAAAVEFGRRLFAGPCEFLRGAVKLDDLPGEALDEVAIAGRSNVGKSSLLNALVGRKALARTSNTPGRTREINFFRLGAPPLALLLVDLPGYGYAKVSRRESAAWTRLVRDYLRGRPRLRRVLVLVDSRHGLKDSDRETLGLLDEAAVASQIVLTKLDKLRADEREAALDAVTREARGFVACHPHVHATSSVTMTGIPGLRADIARFADPQEIAP